MSVYDQASRYASKLKPPRFLRWLLPALPPALSFQGWLDTRTLPFPGEPDRICDTVACLQDDAQPGIWWAIPIEFEMQPRGDMFGRLLVYVGQVWLERRPTDQRGERFQVAAALVNLTGEGRSSRDFQLAGTGLRTCLLVGERNLSTEDAAATLRAIAAEPLDRCLLPWIPLMNGGGESGIITHWLELARTEPNSRLRADYGGLAVVFAEASGCAPQWRQALKGWNMIESPQVREWMAEGELRECRGLLSALLLDRFGAIPEPLAQRIASTDDLARLRAAVLRVSRLQNLEELQL